MDAPGTQPVAPAGSPLPPLPGASPGLPAPPSPAQGTLPPSARRAPTHRRGGRGAGRTARALSHRAPPHPPGACGGLNLLYPGRHNIKWQIKHTMTVERNSAEERERLFSCFLNKGLPTFILPWAGKILSPNSLLEMITLSPPWPAASRGAGLILHPKASNHPRGKKGLAPATLPSSGRD